MFDTDVLLSHAICPSLCRYAGFYPAQKFKGGGNMGEVDVIGRLGGPRGWVQEGDVPPLRKARKAKA